MNFDPKPLIDTVISLALATAHFDDVAGYEPPSAPGRGVRAGVWVDEIVPVRSSGLDSVSIRFTLTVRITRDAGGDELEMIDPQITLATAALMNALSNDFTLGDEAREVDIFGSEGVGLRARAGWVEIDSKRYRAMNVTVPIILNDSFEETP